MQQESGGPRINHGVLAAAGAAWLLTGCQPTVPSDLTGAISDIQLPPGFESQVVFEGTGEARELFIREDGDLFVSLADLRDDFQILGLRDTDGDHSIDIVRPFYRLKTPDEQRAPQVHLEYSDEYLYAVNNEQVVRMHLPPGRLTPARDAEIIVEGIPYQRSHRGRSLSMDSDGWLYVNIGAPSNACQVDTRTPGSPGQDPCPQLEQYAGIWRWRGDLTGQGRADGERYATGIRNAVAQTWDPVYDALYVAQMGRDGLGSLWPATFDREQNAELPAEEFFRVEKGQNFGWPYCYYDPFQKAKVLAPEYGGDGRIVGRCSRFAGPSVAFPAHYSPASIAFYHEEQFPEHYRGGAFIALKGSWNRAPLPQDGYLVAFVPFEDAAPTGEWEVFADGFKGFETLYERGNAVYRPQSVAVHPDGSLYVLDNNKGRIWRITWTGKMTATKLPPQPGNDRELIVAASRGPGADLYNRYCASCHQVQGGGVPGQFPPLEGSAWVQGDKGRLIRTVLHGMQGPYFVAGEQYDEIMPGHAFLSDEDIGALLTFVRSEFANSADPVHESEVVLVRSSDARTTPWTAAELAERTGLVAAPP
ncbi:MAG TPA: PQQ-dependent sugar dehydrogenase [Woeseiaceae bacterium]